MSARPSCRHRLASGAVEVHGDGRVAQLIDRHLGSDRGADIAGETLVRVDLVERIDQSGDGLRVRSRRGDAVVRDGTPVAVTWNRRSATFGPLVAAAHLAARRRHAVLLHGVALSWGGGDVVLVTGPSGAGKTGVLLAALASGATAWAAEWSWVEASSAALWPLPQPVRLRPHHLRTVHAAAAVPARRAAAMRILGRAGRLATSRLHHDVPLADLSLQPVTGLGVLRAVVVLGGDEALVDDVGAFTADAFTGTSSDALVRTLSAHLEIRATPTGAPEATADLARELVA